MERTAPDAKFYKEPEVSGPSVANAKQLHGKALSYNNYVDAEGALNITLEYKDEIAAAVVKHTNPCGFATGKTLIEASPCMDGDRYHHSEHYLHDRKPDLSTVEFLKEGSWN